MNGALVALGIGLILLPLAAAYAIWTLLSPASEIARILALLLIAVSLSIPTFFIWLFGASAFVAGLED